MKRTLLISLSCLLCISLYSQTRNYYAGHKDCDTLTIENSKYIVHSFSYESFTKEHKHITFRSINNRIRDYDDFNIRRKKAGFVMLPCTTDTYVNHEAGRVLLKEVFDAQDCQRLSGLKKGFNIRIKINPSGHICEVEFNLDYTDDDKRILSISPEKLVAIEKRLKEQLHIDLNNDEDPSEKRRIWRKEFFEHFDFDYMPTTLFVRFNGDLEIMNKCDIDDEREPKLKELFEVYNSNIPLHLLDDLFF